MSSERAHVNPGAAVAVGGSVRALIKSNFELKWFRIALEHERAALEARDRAIAAPDGSAEMGEAFDDELRAAMVAIGAAAFAIDALYVWVNEMLEETERPSFAPGVKRPGRIVETLKCALELGKRGNAWQVAIPRLFDLRDDLVHFEGEFQEGAMHPTGKSNVSIENVTYTAEAAATAVDLALDVLTVAYRSPREKHAALVNWSKQSAHVPAWLEGERRGGQ